MNSSDYLSTLLANCQKNLGAAMVDSEVELAIARSMSSLATLSALQNRILQRYETIVFQQALDEGKQAIFLLSIGYYRAAYASLRLFFELNLAAIEFSVNQRFYLNWSQGKADINWGRLIDDDEGVLSKTFCNLFPIDVSGYVKSYRNMAGLVYRECSEFVHGNPLAGSRLPKSNEYDRTVVIDWCNKLETMHLVCVFLFTVRYAPELSTQEKENVSQDVLEQISHLTSVRDFFGGAVGG